MAKKSDGIPDWVSNEIQSAEFGEPQEENRTGYILDVYESDNKTDIQLYEPVEDGRHIITADLAKDVEVSGLQRGVVYAFRFDQLKAPLSDRVIQYLQKEKGTDMRAIYQFELKGLELIDENAGRAADDGSS